MSDYLSKPCTAFEGQRLLSSGPLVEVALAVKAASEGGSASTILVFDDVTGRVVDLDLRGSKADHIERLSRPPQKFVGRYAPRASPPPSASGLEPSEPRERERPKLGVVAREVTLLPRQWLSAQLGGASAVLRRLVDEAKRDGFLAEATGSPRGRLPIHACDAGDLAGYEEATRALFVDDSPKLEQQMLEWPADIRTHVIRLAFVQPNSK